MKNNYSKHRQFFNSFILYFVLGLFLLFFCFIVIYFKSFLTRGSSSNSYNQMHRISQDVLVKSSDGKEKQVNLPAKFSSDYTYSYSFHAEKLEKDEELYLYIKGEYLKFKLRWEDEIIYSFQPFDTELAKSGGIFLRYIHIPEKYVGKDLHVDFEATFKSGYGVRIPEIILGSYSDLLLFHYFNEFDVFVVSMFLFVFGVESILIMILLFFFKKFKIRFLTLSFFAFFSGVALFVDSPLVFMSVRKGVLIYVTGYISFMYLPLFLVLFVLNVFKKEQRGLGRYTFGIVLSILLMINLLVQMILTITGISEFMKMMGITQILFIISLLYIIFNFLFTLKSKEIKDKVFFYISVLIGIGFIALIIINIHTSQIRSVIFIGIGFIFFILYQVYFEIGVYVEKYKEFYIVNLHKGLALIDNLTRLGNRNAFEKDLNTYKGNKKWMGKDMMLMIIDINNLKNMNDTYGHNTGDSIIQITADSIKNALEGYDHCKAYRIGGDEFVVIAVDFLRNHAEKLKEDIEKTAQTTSLIKLEFPLLLGIGYDVYPINEDMDVMEWMNKVDQKMYQDKIAKKREKL